jgi:hypothetical protein
MLPLLEGHLLRKPAYLLPMRSQSVRIKRVATPAQPRVAHMVPFGGPVGRGRGVHQGLMPFVNCKRPVLWAIAVCVRLCDGHISNESRRRPQSHILNLVTNRARHPILRRLISFGKLLQRKTGKDPRVPLRIPVGHTDRRHVADRAIVLNHMLRLGMID